MQEEELIEFAQEQLQQVKIFL
jgi:hypothetical protein